MKRIKLHATERVEVITTATDKTATPTVHLIGPGSAAPVAIPVHPEPLNDITQGGAHDNQIGGTNLYMWVGCFVPDRVGHWRVTVQSDFATPKYDVYDYECTETTAAEDALGISRQPQLLTKIGGVSVASTGELAGSYGVPMNCEWLSACFHDADNGACNFSQAYIPSDGTWSIWGNGTNATRTKYDTLLTGIRVMSKGIDLSAKSEIKDFYVVVLRGDTDGMHAVGFTENIPVARLGRYSASGEYWTEVVFEKPVPVHLGDVVGIMAYRSGGSGFAVFPLVVGAAHCYTGKTELTNGVIEALGGTSYRLTSSGATFVTDGVRGYDVDTTFTSSVYILETNGGPPYQYGAFRVAAVEDNETLLLTDINGNGLTDAHTYDFCVVSPNTYDEDSGALTASSQSTLAMQDLVNGTGKDLVPTAAILELYAGCIFAFDPIVEAPEIVIAGDSVMAGTDSSIGNYGHDHHLPARTYDHLNDIAWHLSQATGLRCVNASVGGTFLGDYMSGTANYSWSRGNTQESQQPLSFKPGIIVFDTTTNNCTVAGYDDRTTYLTRLAKLWTDCRDAGAELVLTSGIPVPARDAEDQARAAKLREWTRQFCLERGIRFIDTYSALMPPEATSDALYDGEDVDGYSRVDFFTEGSVHLKQAGTEFLAKVIAEGLKQRQSPTVSPSVTPPEVMYLQEGTAGVIVPVDFTGANARSTPLLGLTYADMECSYRRQGDEDYTSISLSAGTVGTWSAGGFVEVDGTTVPGFCELGLPDAATAPGASYVVVRVRAQLAEAARTIIVYLTEREPFGDPSPNDFRGPKRQ